MAIKKVDISSINAILDEVSNEELYSVIGGCGSGYSSGGPATSPSWPASGPWW